MSKADSGSGLVPYTSKRESFAESLLKDKKFRESVRESSQTDSLSLEERRGETAAFEKVVDNNITKVRDLEAKKNATQSEEERADFQAAISSVVLQSMLVANVGILKSINLLIDCVTTKCTDDIFKCKNKDCNAIFLLEECKDNKCLKCGGVGAARTRHSRVSVGEILFEQFMEDEEEDDPRVSGRQLNAIVEILYRGFKGTNAEAFKGELPDEFGVLQTYPDVIVEMNRRKQAMEAAARAAGSTMRSGVDDEERADIEKRVMEEYGNGGSPAPAVPASA